MSVFLYGSNKVNEIHKNDLDEENNLLQIPKCFRKRIKSADSGSFYDSLYEEIDFSKLAQHAEKKELYRQSIINRSSQYRSQLSESMKKIALPEQLENFFQNIGLKIIETKEYSSCFSFIGRSVKHKSFINVLKNYLKSHNVENVMSILLSIITLRDGSESFKILEILSRPVRINGNFLSSFLQILISMEVLQTRMLENIFKFFERSTSEDEMVKIACNIYVDLLRGTGKIYEEEKVYNTIISNLKYDKFDTVHRNELASFIYKFIEDDALHNNLYRELMRWIKRNDCENFRLALLKSLKNLFPDPVVAESECFDLTKNINIFGCYSIIEIISYAYRILTSYDRNETVLFLPALKQNFSFEKLEESADFGENVCNIFDKIMMFIDMHRTGLDIVSSVLEGSKNKKITSADFSVTSGVKEEELLGIDEENENNIDREDKDKETTLRHRFSKFDYILSIATVHNYMRPRGRFLGEICGLMAENIENYFESFDEDCRFISKLINCDHFRIKYEEAFKHIAEYFIEDDRYGQIVNIMGEYIFMGLYSNMCYDKVYSVLMEKKEKDDRAI